MRPQLLRAAGRRLRNYILPLVGFWTLFARLEELRSRLEEINAGLPDRSHETADALATRLVVKEERLVAKLETEIDRLDGYLVHHVSTLRAGLGGIQRDLPSLREEVAAIRGEISSLRDRLAALAARRERLCAVPGVGTLLFDAGFDLIVPAQEVGLLSFLLRHGAESAEPGVRTVLRERLRPGDVAVDGGANIGLHALTMATAVGPTGSLVCFEPLPHLADALSWTLRLNGLCGHARVERAALSAMVGDTTFHATPHSPLSSLFDLPESAGSCPIVVSQVNLDAYMPPGSRLDLVKLDIEGAEPLAWRGMRRVLRENPLLDVVMEWSSSHFARASESPSDFFREIRADGFSVFLIEDEPEAGRLTIETDAEAVAALEATNVLVTRRPPT